MDDDLTPEQVSDLATSVGNDLFGGGSDPSSLAEDETTLEAPAEGQTADAVVPASVATPPTTSPAIDPAAQVTPDVPPLPKSWKKETEALWTGASPELRQQILQREADISRGIQMYRNGHESWSQITAPYADLLAKYPDVNPVQLYSNFMENHLALLFGSPEQKKAKAMELLRGYQIDLGTPTGTPSPAPVTAAPEYQALQSRLNSIESRFRDQSLAEQNRLVEAFFADPKNEFAEDLADDIATLIKSGQAPDLQTAYEQAQWLNPQVRQKILDKQFQERQAAATAEATKKANLKRLNVDPTSTPASPAGKKGSIDDTINAVVSKHYSPSNLM